MSTATINLNREMDHALAKAEQILGNAERAGRSLTHNEQLTVDECLAKANDHGASINMQRSRADELSRLRQVTGPRPVNVFAAPDSGEKTLPRTLSASYAEGFWKGMRRGDFSGPDISAQTSEGTSTAGGFAVPVVVDENIVPLAPTDSAVRRLAQVVPTVSDRRIPRVTGLPAATAKAEGSGFGASVSTLGQLTLTAYGVGIESDASMELFDDVPLYVATTLRDNTFAFLAYEEGKFLSGNGTTEPQGILSNVDVGVAAATADGGGNLFSVASTFDILDTLKDAYHANASWLMQRSTAVSLRKAQLTTGAFEKVFTRENGQDLLHGYPVFYSGNVPSVAAGNTVAVFGDFKSGYIIGDRGGSALRVSVLDQTNLAQGLFTLLFYRRTDGKVRNPEALKSLTLHS